MEEIRYLSEAMERIRQMEERLDRLLALAERDVSMVQQTEDFRILLDYYEGGLWLRDYALDEQGLLPKELKRGILSEDGFWNLLAMCR